jgi:hypothetical protein
VYQGSAKAGEVTIDSSVTGYFQSALAYWPGYGFVDDGFKIDGTAKTFYYYMDSTLETYWGGTIVKVIPQSDSEPAILIIEITEATGDWWADPPEVGKYFAAAYQNPTEFAVSSSTAYNSETGYVAKNTGVDTVAEAVREYTKANKYFPATFPLYYPHNTATAATLSALQGDWYNEDMDYYVVVKGTTYTEFMDGEEYDGVYDTTADEDDMLAAMGDIVDHTDTTQTSGVLYVKILDGGYTFTVDKYIAVAWKDLTATSVSIMTSTQDYDTLAAVKAALNDAEDTDQFDEDGFYDYVIE